MPGYCPPFQVYRLVVDETVHIRATTCAERLPFHTSVPPETGCSDSETGGRMLSSHFISSTSAGINQRYQYRNSGCRRGSPLGTLSKLDRLHQKDRFYLAYLIYLRQQHLGARSGRQRVHHPVYRVVVHNMPAMAVFFHQGNGTSRRRGAVLLPVQLRQRVVDPAFQVRQRIGIQIVVISRLSAARGDPRGSVLRHTPKD